MTKIKIIVGSSRPGRFNIQPATWIHDLAKESEDIEAELVDLKEVNLPFLDEAVPASQGQYANEHTKDWAKTIGDADGFIFVTPEYNHSYSPVLKNAIDYVYAEWNYKPVSFVSYGSLAGGARAVEHLRGVAGELKMYDIREQILLPDYWTNLSGEGQYQFTETQTEAAKAMLESLAFWAGKMKEARAELQG